MFAWSSLHPLINWYVDKQNLHLIWRDIVYESLNKYFTIEFDNFQIKYTIVLNI